MDSIGQMHELLRLLSGFTGSQILHFKPVDICQILSNMLTFIHREAEVHNIKINHSYDDSLPVCEVDQREIKQLFLNLLKNAIEAMPDGGILNVEAHLAGTRDAICISISDSGQGLDEYGLRMLFKPFFTTKPDGTGLGLSFCRRVVEKHDGEISASSELGKGTIFTILLPILHEEI
jgi:signal transduction histidine kinase